MKAWTAAGLLSLVVAGVWHQLYVAVASYATFLSTCNVQLEYLQAHEVFPSR